MQLVDAAYLNPTTGSLAVELENRGRADHDRGDGLSDVDRRANRRIWHRQWNQSADHGWHSGRHAGGGLRTCSDRPRWNWAEVAGKLGIEDLLLLAAMFVAVVVGVVYITLGPTSHSHAKCQACSRSPRLWWHAAIPPAESQSGGRHADHLCQQPADVAALVFSQLSRHSLESWRILGQVLSAGPAMPSRATAISTSCLRRADLLLLFFLDRDYVQSQRCFGESEELRFVYPRLPARQADGRLSWKRSCFASPTSALASWPWWRLFR